MALAAQPEVVTLTGQDSPVLWQQWTTENGLPQNTVTAIAQTPDGYIWLGTFGGLARFDGVRFQIFNTANTPALNFNRITVLQVDREGWLWIGAESGDVVLYKQGTFTHFARSAPHLVVISIYRDQHNTLWVGDSKGIHRYANTDPLNHSYLTQPEPADFLQDPETYSYCQVEEDARGRLWAIFSSTLWYSDDGMAFVKAENLVPHIFNLRLTTEGMLFYGFTKNFAKNEDTGFVGRLTGSDGKEYQRVIDKAKYIRRSLTEGPKGAIWAIISDHSLSKIEAGRQSLYNLAEIGTNRPISLLPDQDGNVWVGTSGDGLFKLAPRHLRAWVWPKQAATQPQLSTTSLNTIVTTGDDHTWAGDDSGLTHWHKGQATRYTTRNGLPNNRIKALWPEADGSLWLNTYEGIFRWQAGKFTSFPQLSRAGWGGLLLFKDSRGRLWAGTSYWDREAQNKGLAEIVNGRLARQYALADGLPALDWRSAAESPDGTLWFGSAEGFVRLAEGKFTYYRKQEGFPNEYVRDIFADEDGALWLATYGGGLSRFQDGRFTSVSTREGLFDDFISRILPDDKGNFWLLGNQGIFAVNRAALHAVAGGQAKSVACVAFGIADGMITSEGQGGCSPAGWRGRDGKLWFPMINGFVMLDPQNALPPPPTPVLEEARLEGQPLNLNQTLTIRPGQGNLEIVYTGIGFNHPEQIRFRYKLEGLDQDWTEAGTRRTAYFSYLPPGRYRFVVSATSAGGVWSVSGQHLEIVVRAPFWRRGWFMALALLVVSGAIGLLMRWRWRQYEKARRRQEEFARQLLNAQESERQRLARELHDGLSQQLVIIKNWAAFCVQRADNGAAFMRPQLEEIGVTAADALKDVRRLAHNLSPYQLEKAGLTKTLKFMVRQVAASSGIECQADIAPLDGLFDQEGEIHLYRIVQEALNNIIRHSGATLAGVQAIVDDQGLTLNITDNGHGFPVSATMRTETPGLGLGGIIKRAKMLGGQCEISSVPGHGARVRVTAPFH